ncbi:MAG: hypothetical protein KAU29_03845 [Gammaproteobacteria bacterium]|nr:hypothetical protein [Gammaproteobacteria bacterium]
MDQDLSGTWRHTLIDEYFDNATGASLGSRFLTSHLIFDDAPTSSVYSDCINYGLIEYSVTKTETSLSLATHPVDFSVIANNIFETAPILSFEPMPVGQTVMRRYRLEKLTADIDIDQGAFTLSDPINITETDHVCGGRTYTDVIDDNTYKIDIPYDNDILEMRLRLSTALLSTGVHNYTQFDAGAEIFSFSISSNSANFMSVTGTNTLAPSTATMTITESTASIITGTFSFIGPGAENYTGSFSMDINP